MRVILTLVMSLILAMASLTEAVARSEMAGATSQALCGTGSVLLDATGKPMAAHSCAHCLAASVAAVGLNVPVVTRPETRARGGRPATTMLAQSRPLPAALARGPPGLV
jgi:hypothetical protein